MARYARIRFFQGIITLLILATIVFILARLIGSPIDMLLPPDATLEQRQHIIQKLGLDQPLYVQYGKFIGDLLRGDLGDSFIFGKPVVELFLKRFPNTLRLAIVSVTIAMVFGLQLGVLSGTHRGSLIDRFSRVVSVIGMSAPSFWVGLMLMLIFAVQLRVLPVARMGGPDSYILPGLTWSFLLLAGTARLVRSSMIEVLDSEYVKLAWIKGVSRNMVVWKHCLRNALLPVFTFAGVQLALLLNGSVVIEAVFAWPGVGLLVYNGIVGRDYPLIQGCLIMVGSLIIVINFTVDILYSYIDPRIRITGSR